MNPARIEGEIERLYELLESESDRFAVTAEAAGDAEADFKLGLAEAKLGLVEEKMTVDIRDASALVACRDLYRRHKRMEKAEESGKQTLRRIQAQLDVLRTLESSSRALVK